MTGKGNSYILLILSMLAWGSVYPISKFLMAEVSPFLMAFLRYSVAVVALTPFFIVEKRKNSNSTDAKSIIIFLVAGIAGVAVFAFFLFTGVNLSTASNGSVIINTQPVFTAVLAPLLLHERLTRIQLIGILTGLAGMFLVVTGGDFGVILSGSSLLKGNLLLVAGSVLMSLYGIILKNSIRRYGGMIPTWYSMFFGTIVLFIFNIFTGSFSGATAVSVSGMEIFLIIYLGTVATAFAYLLFNLSLRKTEVLIATSFKFLIPVSGILLSVLFIGERPAGFVYAGVIIVIFSVFLIQQRGTFSRAATGKTEL